DCVETVGTAPVGMMRRAVAHAPPDKKQSNEKNDRYDNGCQGRQRRQLDNTQTYPPDGRRSMRCPTSGGAVRASAAQGNPSSRPFASSSSSCRYPSSSSSCRAFARTGSEGG